MNKVIKEYVLEEEYVYELDLPIGAKILSASDKFHKKICVYALVDSNEERTERYEFLALLNNDAQGNLSQYKFLDTVKVDDEILVMVHVFYKKL